MELVERFKDYIIYDNVVHGRRADGSIGINEIFDALKEYYTGYGAFGLSIIGVNVNEKDFDNRVEKIDGKYVLKNKNIALFGNKNHVLPIRLVVEILKENLEIERKEVLINKLLPYRIDAEITYKSIEELKEEENFVYGYLEGVAKSRLIKGVGFDIPSGEKEKMNPAKFLIYFGPNQMKLLKSMYVKGFKETDKMSLLNTLKPELKDKVDKKLSNKDVYDKFITVLERTKLVRNLNYNINGGEFLIELELNPKERLVIGTNFMYKETLIHGGNSINKRLLYNLSKGSTVEEALNQLENHDMFLLDFIGTLLDGRKNPLKLFSEYR